MGGEIGVVAQNLVATESRIDEENVRILLPSMEGETVLEIPRSREFVKSLSAQVRASD